jgi:hypothetical protein
MTANRTITITPVSPPGLGGVTFALWGDATYKMAGSGSGGWQVIDRPRLVAITQWYDRSPFSLDLPLAIDSEVIFGEADQSIESFANILESWMDRVPGTNQPPVLNISGPTVGLQRQWVLYTFEYHEAIRDATAGFRTQQKVQLTLYEYNAPLVAVTNNPTPATVATQALAAQTVSQSYALYTVKTGDTLSSIAAARLGNFASWTILATLNNIRDPNSLTPGQTLEIPQQP